MNFTFVFVESAIAAVKTISYDNVKLEAVTLLDVGFQPTRRFGRTPKICVILHRWADHLDRDLPSERDIDTYYNNTDNPFSVVNWFLAWSGGLVKPQFNIFPWRTSPVPMSEFSENKEMRNHVINYIDKHFGPNDAQHCVDEFNEGRVIIMHSGLSQLVEAWRFPNTPEKRPGPQARSLNYRIGDYFLNDFAISTVWSRFEPYELQRRAIPIHELIHMYGYRNGYLGYFDLMSSPSGMDRSDLFPIITPWQRLRFGFSFAHEVTCSGNYWIPAIHLGEPSVVLVLKKNYRYNEYLLIEYRIKNFMEPGFPTSEDSTVPGGVLVWHILGDKLDEKIQITSDDPNDPEILYERWGRSLVQFDGNFLMEKGKWRDIDSGVYMKVGDEVNDYTVPSIRGYGDGHLRNAGWNVKVVYASKKGAVVNVTNASFKDCSCDDQDSFYIDISQSDHIPLTSYRLCKVQKGDCILYSNHYIGDLERTIEDVRSFVDCLSLCYRAEGCDYVNYDTKVESCQLMKSVHGYKSNPDSIAGSVNCIGDCPTHQLHYTGERATCNELSKSCIRKHFSALNIPPLMVLQATSLEECVNSCFTENSCYFAEWNRRMNRCSFFASFEEEDLKYSFGGIIVSHDCSNLV